MSEEKKTVELKDKMKVVEFNKENEVVELRDEQLEQVAGGHVEDIDPCPPEN